MNGLGPLSSSLNLCLLPGAGKGMLIQTSFWTFDQRMIQGSIVILMLRKKSGPTLELSRFHWHSSRSVINNIQLDPTRFWKNRLVQPRILNSPDLLGKRDGNEFLPAWILWPTDLVPGHGLWIFPGSLWGRVPWKWFWYSSIDSSIRTVIALAAASGSCVRRSRGRESTNLRSH